MKKIPWWQPQIGKQEHILINQVLDTHFPNEGNLTKEFEQQITSLLDVKYALAVTSATAAIFLALKALKIGFGDEVIVPDISFIATANAVIMAGATPILIDVDKNTLTLDPASFEKAITKKTKAVIPVHVSGRPANMTKILSIAKKGKIYVIEDAAEGFMSKYQGKSLGTIGDIGCFSFSPAKVITTGQGGAVVTNNKILYKTLQRLKDQGRQTRGTGGDDIHQNLGYNFKFTDLQAAVGLGQLHYLKKRVNRIQKTYTLYKKYLADTPQVSILEFNLEKGELPLWIDAKVKKRDKLVDYLKKHGIDCRNFWYPIHTQQAYKKANRNFPVSTIVATQALWLPSAFTLTDDDVFFVCKNIKTYYNR